MGGSGHKRNDVLIVSKTQAASIKAVGRVDLVKKDFDDLVLQKGYDAYVEKAIKCPCRNVKDTQALSSCKNCGGSGWVFFNRLSTRVVLQGMGANVGYKEWSEVEAGTAKVTVTQDVELSFMDRITIINGFTIHNQVVHCILTDSKIKGQLLYDPVEIAEIFLFETTGTKLKFLVHETDFTVSDNVITLNDNYLASHTEDNPITLSVRYKHNPQYHVIDIPRDTIASYEKTGSVETNQLLPHHAIARKSHYVIDATNYGAEWLFNNDYTPACSIYVASQDIAAVIRRIINTENSDQTLEELLASGAYLTVITQDPTDEQLLALYDVDQVDDVTSDITVYVGKIKNDASTKWAIEKITVVESDNEDLVTVEYINGIGNATYISQWDNRVALTYVAIDQLTNL